MTPELIVIDEALAVLRRLWADVPRPPDQDGRVVEMSEVVVVEACAKGAADGAEVTVGDVARFAAVGPSTASRLVQRAHRNGLVYRLPSSGTDGRTVLGLSASGRDLQVRAAALRTQWLATVLAGWEPTEVRELAGSLRRLAQSVRAQRDRG